MQEAVGVVCSWHEKRQITRQAMKLAMGMRRAKVAELKEMSVQAVDPRGRVKWKSKNRSVDAKSM